MSTQRLLANATVRVTGVSTKHSATPNPKESIYQPIPLDPKSYTTNSSQQHQPSEQALVQERALKGRKAWRLIHSYNGNDPNWFVMWLNLIPGFCDCSTGAQTFINSNPPDFSSPEKVFEFSVTLHNLVNEKIGKQYVDFNDAKAYWEPIRNSLYGLRIPFIHGGIERWAISMASNLPCYGFSRVTDSMNTSSELYAELTRYTEECTLDEIRLARKIILVSNDHDFVRPMGAKTVLVAHGPCEYTKGWVQRIHAQCDKLVGVSKTVSDKVTEWTGRQCTTIENGIDVDRIKPLRDRDEYRKELGIPNHAVVLGYNGRFTDEKGVTKFIQVIGESSDFYGVLSGWGDPNFVLEKAKALGVDKRIVILKPVPQVGNILTICDYYLSLSLQEGFGLAGLEALMFGVPVVSTDTGILSYLHETRSKHVECGFKIVPTNATSLEIVQAIDKAKSDLLDYFTLQYYTSQSMAFRWKTFLQEMEQECYYGKRSR